MSSERKPTPRQAEAVRLRAAGWTGREIAAELGVSPQAVYQMLDRAAKPKPCPRCGKPVPFGRKLCSIACRKNKQPRPPKPCPYCGKPLPNRRLWFCGKKQCRDSSRERRPYKPRQRRPPSERWSTAGLAKYRPLPDVAAALAKHTARTGQTVEDVVNVALREFLAREMSGAGFPGDNLAQQREDQS